VRDHVDRIFEQWAVERPDLDRSAMAVLARILRAARIVDLEMGRVFAEDGLHRGEFDVLATLRRAGNPYRLNPTDLSATVLLSTGAMTNRLDRLESAGLVRRLPDPEDRRGVLVELTAEGRSLIDRVLTAHVRNEERILESLTDVDRRQLTRLLRKLLVSLGEREASSERVAS
jgi:DNA-binding MarR family transcriptional regulator